MHCLLCVVVPEVSRSGVTNSRQFSYLVCGLDDFENIPFEKRGSNTKITVYIKLCCLVISSDNNMNVVIEISAVFAAALRCCLLLPLC